MNLIFDIKPDDPQDVIREAGEDRIAVIGSLNYDVIMNMPHFPAPGETLAAESAAFAAGGKGANQAAQAAKLGAEVYMIGCVGDDLNGRFLLETARGYGVKTDFVRTADDQPTGMAFIQAVHGQNSIAVLKGANQAVTREDIDRAAQIILGAEVVILQNEIPQEVNEYVLELLHKNGVASAAGSSNSAAGVVRRPFIILNAAPAVPIPAKYLSYVDLLMVNEIEAEFYLGAPVTDSLQAIDSAKELARKYMTNVIITLGSKGSVLAEVRKPPLSGTPDPNAPLGRKEISMKMTYISAVRVHAVDSTGAGDSYTGALAYALTQGSSLEDACHFAARCSAIAVCGLGAQPAMPTLKEVEAAK